MIKNPNPVTATFEGMWITNVAIIFPEKGKTGSLNAKMQPWEGEHLLMTGGKQVNVWNLTQSANQDAALSSILESIKTNMARLSGNSEPLKMVQVVAIDPAKPIFVQAVFNDNKVYRIQDADALTKTDSEFAQCFGTALGKIASLGGLSIV